MDRPPKVMELVVLIRGKVKVRAFSFPLKVSNIVEERQPATPEAAVVQPRLPEIPPMKLPKVPEYVMGEVRPGVEVPIEPRVEGVPAEVHMARLPMEGTEEVPTWAVMVGEVPPTRAPKTPFRMMPPPAVTEVVATLAKVFADEKYGIFPSTAAEEVERPLKPSTAPVRVIGQVVEMAACFELRVACRSVPLSERVPKYALVEEA